MKTVRFQAKDKRQFAVALRKNVYNYFKENQVSAKGNSTMITKAVALLAIYLVPFILMLTLPMPGWVIFPITILMGIGMAGIGMSVMHDAVHGSFSRYGWVNKFFGNTMYLLGGNVMTWKVQHNMLHHTYTNIDGMDEDINSKIIFRFSKHAPLRKIHRLQHIYAFAFYSLMTISKLVRDFFSLHEYEKKGYLATQKVNPKKELVRMIISKTIYLFVTIGLPMLLTGFSWWLILLGFLVMHLTAGMIMSIVFQLAHVVEETGQPLPNETGVIENDWAIHEFETTSNFARNSTILNWFIGGLNFQIEHHLFPDICHVHYKRISAIVERTALEYGVPYNVSPSFIHAVRSHVRVLKRLGRAA